ncbi:MAG TPA: hypothetical protein VGM67_06605 [Gemmatimonadaceae bacterium]|jgi:hypothetical protein
MAIFMKRKEGEAPTPDTCARCGTDTGVVHLHFTAAPDATGREAALRPVWLCEACQASATGSPKTN